VLSVSACLLEELQSRCGPGSPASLIVADSGLPKIAASRSPSLLQAACRSPISRSTGGYVSVSAGERPSPLADSGLPEITASRLPVSPSRLPVLNLAQHRRMRCPIPHRREAQPSSIQVTQSDRRFIDFSRLSEITGEWFCLVDSHYVPPWLGRSSS
jgi:hypothetical protein